jgi:hypothetical protein
MALKNTEKTGNSTVRAKQIVEELSKNPELLTKFAELFQKENLLEKAKKEFFVPDSVFSSKLTILESFVKYLKENSKLDYKSISNIVGRDQRNIWQIYNSAKKKSASRFSDKQIKLMIPASVLSNKKFSALENIAAYLKESGHTYHETAVILKRDDRTIWTVYSRYKKKNAK